jgi:hypothetical protein
MRESTRASDLRVIAVDWSGKRTGAEKTIWLAEVGDGELLRLENGRTREGVASELIELAHASRRLVAGLDFAFSMPAWFLRKLGVRSGPELWARACVDGERWLAACEPPFWGRPGRRRPELAAHLRGDEAAYARSNGVTPKSVFQIGGSGTVGTGSLRGMPMLQTLHEAGFSIWPFCEPGAHTVLEIYPRALTGTVTKSRADARTAYLRTNFPALPPAMRDLAASTEDAFDAAVSALRMWQHRDELTSLERATDAAMLLEGAIWLPADRRAGVGVPA